jgi:trk system potassium uptake protein TrkH
MFSENKEKDVRKSRLQPVQILAIGFAITILVGALLLMLPISSVSRQITPFVDCLFVSTSATCVTGLVTVDTGTHWSVFGQVVIMMLIQIGGLGFMTFATLIAIVIGKRISFRERLIMQEAYNAFNVQGIVRMVLYVISITLTIELTGAVLLSTQFIPIFGWTKGMFFGLFHSVSAFCNAGFDLLGSYSGPFTSITSFYDNTVIVLTIGGLIVLGGIGFAVIMDVLHVRSLRKLSLHSKVVITATTFLLITGTILFFIFEYGNPETMGNMSFKGKLLSSIFASITPRTAGYNSISTTGMTGASKFLTIILMFIGASPGSTGGGIKTTTATLIFLVVVSVIRGREDAEAFHKRISRSLVCRAVAIATISFGLVVLVTMILSLTETGNLEMYLYEATSAFGTVGLTLDLPQVLQL